MITIPRPSYFGLLLNALLIFACSGPAFAADEKLPLVPLKKVVLFNSGLGFFGHEGEVDGDQQVELKFNVDDVNDLLKSMVLEDLGGGRISTVTYSAREPVTRTLKTFAIDLTRNPSLAELLRQVRGEKVQVEAPNPITGTIVGIERRRVKAGKDDTVEIDVLNLLTATGLRSIPMDNIQQTQLLDPKLNSELQEALAILSKAHRSDKKTVTLDFAGKGKRNVRIGYVQEFPVWKTSYRLVVKDDGSLFLQGWAIVENTTEQDWNNVNLSLVSGQPISFIQDLYEPLYVDRPVVVPDAFASLTPRIYNQDLAAADADFRRAANGNGQVGQGRLNPSFQFQNGGGLGGQAGFAGGGFGGNMGNGAAPNARRPAVTSVVPVVGGGAAAGADNGTNPANAAAASNDNAIDLKRGVAAMADADKVGELFRYAIDAPVTLARQKSAMLPIVNKTVKGEKLSIYNQDVHAKHPLNGLKLINSTGLHLMQGPITVFDGGEYAGDARIEDLQPGTERLVSYALDLDTEVAPIPEQSSESLAALTIAGTALTERHVIDRTRSYTIKNSGAAAKNLLIEYPIDPQWTLITRKELAEKTRDLYRFLVKAEPGKAARLEVAEQRTEKVELPISNLPGIATAKIGGSSTDFVIAVREQTNDSLAGVKLAKGVVIETHAIVRTRQFVVRNAGGKVANVPVDYALDPQWNLVSPKATAGNDKGIAKFELPFSPGEPAMLAVVEQRTAQAEIPLARLDDERIADYLNSQAVGPEIKAELTDLVKRRQAIAALAARKAQLEDQIKEVGDEQSRIRQNMTQLDHNSELYSRYVKKFGAQEDEVERLRQQLRDLSAELDKQRKSLEDRFAETIGATSENRPPIVPNDKARKDDDPFGTEVKLNTP